tara:strand:- start:37043 stop:37405 length:363 start_codon:yes stop_codon:yes gene_type:complete
METPSCLECVFSDFINSKLHCRRYPTAIRTLGTAWCGEFIEPEPSEASGPLEWRELEEGDPEARLILSSLPIETEFRDLEDGGSWHLLADHLEEVEAGFAGNTGAHVKAGLRLRIPSVKK